MTAVGVITGTDIPGTFAFRYRQPVSAREEPAINARQKPISFGGRKLHPVQSRFPFPVPDLRHGFPSGVRPYDLQPLRPTGSS